MTTFATATGGHQQLESCLNAVNEPAAITADDDDDEQQQQSTDESAHEATSTKLDTAAPAAVVVVTAATDESVSSSSFTNSTTASINSRTILGANNINNNASSSQHQPPPRRVLAFQLDGAVHRRRHSAANASKNPIQMLSNLFSSMMGVNNGARKYGIKRQILQRNPSSMRRPQLVSLRSRGSIHHQQANMVVDMDNDNNNNNKNNSSRENAFDMLLRFCDTPADIAFLRDHPDHMERLGIPVEQYSTILEELQFFLNKREQLREAEQRVRQRKPPKREKNAKS